ncbi:MAG: hypothetical protein NDF55_09115 [archaeon GB-1867-005]|nr:hypothetical protein [Candidatus Culexmicrobium cathedralense]
MNASCPRKYVKYRLCPVIIPKAVQLVQKYGCFGIYIDQHINFPTEKYLKNATLATLTFLHKIIVQEIPKVVEELGYKIHPDPRNYKVHFDDLDHIFPRFSKGYKPKTMNEKKRYTVYQKEKKYRLIRFYVQPNYCFGTREHAYLNHHPLSKGEMIRSKASQRLIKIMHYRDLYGFNLQGRGKNANFWAKVAVYLVLDDEGKERFNQKYRDWRKIEKFVKKYKLQTTNLLQLVFSSQT